MRSLAELMFALLAAITIGALLGWLSKFAYVIALAPLLIGIGAGAAASVAALGLRGRVGRSTAIAGALAAVVGLVTMAGFEDAHLRAAWTLDYAQARYVAGGVPVDAALADEDLPFYESGASDELERQVIEAAGAGGPVGRWLMRADAGVRLIGPWGSSRGLSVGRWGAIVWAALELLLAAWMVRLVVTRVGARSEELGRQGEQDDSGA